MTKPNVIEMHDITKKFGEFVANDHINLDVRPGEIHALLGENGAGKSTLMNMLAGLLQPTSGIIKVNGQEVTIDSPSKATKLGIGMVHQHFKLVDNFTVTENIILGCEPKKGLVVDIKTAAKRIEEATGMETRATILGHMQRGGSPTCKDRVYASIMGAKAVDLLLEGKTNRVVGYKHGEYVDFDIDEALGMTKGIPAYQYEIAKELAL